MNNLPIFTKSSLDITKIQEPVDLRAANVSERIRIINVLFIRLF